MALGLPAELYGGMDPYPVNVPRRSLLAGAAATPLLGLGLAACDPAGQTGPDGEGGPDGDGAGEIGEPDLRAELPRAEPGPAEGTGRVVVPFTARMLGAIGRDTINAVCSPLSAQVALAMTGLGAAGDTRAQMEAVLGGAMDELATASNTLSSVLAAVGDEERETAEDGDSGGDGAGGHGEDGEELPEPAVASLVNAVWAQQGMTVQEAYLEDLATHFGSGVYEADFLENGTREQARERINGFVAEATGDLIEELIAQGFLTADSRMVLVNALHLKAAWHQPLATSTGPFTLADGSEVESEMLSGTTRGWYEDDLCRATSLGTYGDDLALALVQPVADVPTVLDAWAEIEGGATDSGSSGEASDGVGQGTSGGTGGAAGGLGAMLEGLAEPGTVNLTAPAFDIEWGGSLADVLKGLGMELAFQGAADFSGITAEEGLFISDVVQKAVITVDKDGMEAAAATAVGMEASAADAEPRELLLDEPFLFVAYETSTLAPLVLGWIGDPSQTR